MKTRTKSDLLSNTSNVKSSKVVARNTLKIEYENGNTAIRLHDTDIITKLPNGNSILTSGGYRTPTTKERLNLFSPSCIYQEKGIWYMRDGSMFFDGIEINEKGEVIGEKRKANIKEVDKVKRQISKFVSNITKDNLPIPSNGDCWLCNMRDVKTGKTYEDNDHLIEHIKENYLHGSLLVNAMREEGYRDEQIAVHYQFKFIDTFKRALRKYLQKRLIKDIAIK